MKRFFQNGGIPTDMIPRDSMNNHENLLRLPQNTGTVYNATSFPMIPTSLQSLSPMPTPMFPMSSSSQYFDMQSTRTSSPAPSATVTMLGTSPYGAIQNVSLQNNESTAQSASHSHSIERGDLHKGLKSLESLLIAFDEYRDLKVKLAKCEKRLAKNMLDMSKLKMLENVPSQTLQSSAILFDSIIETTSKHAKLIQREYEAMNEHCNKYFKRIAKEEKTHDELMDTLDSKVKKAHATHEKNSKRSGKVAIESHDRYIQSVQALTQDISRAKASHGSMIGTKTYIMSLVIASTLGGMADSEFKATCENVRKAGPHIGKVNEWLNFASAEGMTFIQPVDLSEDGTGWAQALTQRESEIAKEMRKVEEAKLASLEHAQTVWKAQQMGWIPPSIAEAGPRRLPTPPTAISNKIKPDLPRLDSKGVEVRPIQEATDILQSVPKADLAKFNIAMPTPSRNGSSELNKMTNIIMSDSQLDKAEETSPDSHSKDSSMTEGTIIDKEVKVDQSKHLVEQEASISTYASSPAKSSNSSLSQNLSSGMTSLSMSQRDSRSSEGEMISDGVMNRSRGPCTPTDEKTSQEVIVMKNSPEKVEGILKRPEMITQAKFVTPEKPLDRYVDLEVRQALKSLQRVDSIPDRSHQLNLWEQEREKERQTEREEELKRRLKQAEDRLRDVNSGAQYTSTSVKTPASRPRYSEPLQSYRSQHLDHEIPAHRYEPDQYTPATCDGRVSNLGVNRTLSTDSERSFVARMKARYQAEKDEKYGQAPLRSANVYVDTLMATLDPPYGMPARGTRDTPRSGQYKDLHRQDCSCSDCSRHDYPHDAKISMQRESLPPPTSNRPSSRNSSAPPPNYRRQSMPPVREEYTSLKAPPAASRDVHLRRSFEEEKTNTERKVMFATKSYR